MNFFGHAVVAAWRRPEPPFVLGAMLPDFATMIRARPPGSGHEVIEQGIAFHHETDDVFHRSATFLDLSRAAFGWLLARGVGRGSARAVAHIGIEMLLELPLAADLHAQRLYRDALTGAADTHLGRHVGWRSHTERASFERLRTALLARGEMSGDVAPEVIAERLRRALSGRPLLALDEAAVRAVRDWIVAVRLGVAAQAQPLVRELSSQLMAAR
jgi:hypothetical protein